MTEIEHKEIERLKEEKESWKRVATKNFNEAEDYKSIIKEAREEVRIYEVQSKDGITNELDNYVFVQRLKNVLNKGE